MAFMRFDRSRKLPRFVSLLVAVLSCTAVAVPLYIPLTHPNPLILLGSGITVVGVGIQTQCLHAGWSLRHEVAGRVARQIISPGALAPRCVRKRAMVR